MKNLTGLLCIAIITITGFLIGFTDYTTDPMKTTTTEAVTATATSEAAQKKSCVCCAKHFSNLFHFGALTEKRL